MCRARGRGGPTVRRACRSGAAAASRLPRTGWASCDGAMASVRRGQQPNRFAAAPARQTTFVLAAFRDVREASEASVDGGRTRDADASDADARQLCAANKLLGAACRRYATQQHVISRAYSAPYAKERVRAALWRPTVCAHAVPDQEEQVPTVELTARTSTRQWRLLTSQTASGGRHKQRNKSRRRPRAASLRRRRRTTAPWSRRTAARARGVATRRRTCPKRSSTSSSRWPAAARA